MLQLEPPDMVSLGDIIHGISEDLQDEDLDSQADTIAAPSKYQEIHKINSLPPVSFLL